MLKGHTRNIPLSNIMQTLVLNQQGGILSVQFHKMERHLAISGSNVSLVTERPYASNLLQQTLSRLSILSGNEFQNVVSTTSGAQPPGDTLIARHLLTPEQVTSAVREQFQEAIFEIFEWRNASYSFDIMPLQEDRAIFSDADLTRGLEFQVNGILMEVARREDEWTRIRESIPHARQIYRVDTAALADHEVRSSIALSQGRLDALLHLLNSDLTLEEVLENSSIPPFFIFSTLRLLLQVELAAPLNLSEKKKLAERAQQQFQLERAEGICQSILEDHPDEIGVRKTLLAQLEKRKASADEMLPHLRSLAKAAADGGEGEVARQHLDRIIELDPHDLDALEQVTRVDIQEAAAKEKDRDKDIATILTPFTKTVRNRREYERGIQFLLSLAEERPTDSIPQQEAGHLFLLAGRPEEAKTHYEAAAKLLLQQRKLGQLRKIVDKLEACDERAAAKWRRYVNGQSSKKGHKGLVRGAIAAAAVLVLGAVAFATYEWNARVSYAEVLEDARSHARDGDLLAAEKLLSDFQSEHQYALISREVSKDLHELVQRQGPSDTETSRATEHSRPKRPDELNDASETITQATLLKNRGDYRGALKLYRSIDSKGLSDLLKETIQAEKKYLANYLETAQRLYAEARGFSTRGQIDEASRRMIALLDKYPNAGLQKEIRLPVRVDVLPPNASVFVNNQRIEGPPYILQTHPEELTTVHVAAPGFSDRDEIVDPRKTRMVRIELQKEARWVATLEASVEATPLAANGKVFAGTRSGKVVAVYAPTGKKAWEYELQGIGDPLGAIHSWGSNILFTGTDRAIYGVNAANGELVFRTEFPQGAGLTRVAMTPPDPEGRTFVMTSKGRLLAFDGQSGELLWNRPVGGSGSTPPLAAKDRVIVAKRDGVVLCLSAVDGSELWRSDHAASISATPTIGKQTIVTAYSNGDVRSFSLASGQELWSTKIPIAIRALTTVPDHGIVAVDQQGRIRMLAEKGGKEIWSTTDLGQVLGTPIVSGAEILAANDQGQFIAISAKDGLRRWQYHVGSRPSCDPALVEGTLIMAGHDHRVHCLRIQ